MSVTRSILIRLSNRVSGKVSGKVRETPQGRGGGKIRPGERMSGKALGVKKKIHAGGLDFGRGAPR